MFGHPSAVVDGSVGRDDPEVRAVHAMPYPDFVAFLGQHNTPPGGLRTVAAWVRAGRIGPGARLLDLACSTGFSGRAAAGLASGVTVHGIDISADAIDRAREYSAGDPAFGYEVADAAALPLPDGAFTHVLGGCNFGFIQDRDRALDECHRVLRPDGLLCVASFHYRRRPPEALLDGVEAVIGFRPDAGRDRAYWNTFFGRRFELVQEQRTDLDQVGARQVARTVARTTGRRCTALRGASRPVRQAAYERLLATRLVLNEHRAYQGLSVAVWRARPTRP